MRGDDDATSTRSARRADAAARRRRRRSRGLGSALVVVVAGVVVSSLGGLVPTGGVPRALSAGAFARVGDLADLGSGAAARTFSAPVGRVLRSAAADLDPRTARMAAPATDATPVDDALSDALPAALTGTPSDLCVDLVAGVLDKGSADYRRLVAAAGGSDLDAWCTDRVGALPAPTAAAPTE